MGHLDRFCSVALFFSIAAGIGALANAGAAVLLLPLAIVTEGPPPVLGVNGRASLAYVGLFATAFAYWAVVELGRRYRASTMAMALMVAPTLGVLLSALTTGEEIGASLITGVVLIAAGNRLATVQM